MGAFALGAIGILFTVQAVQGPEAAISGLVWDEETGQPLVGATVVLPDLGRGAVTDASGRYLFHEVPAGPQPLVVRFIGYTPRTLQALVPRDGELEINLSLRADPIRLPTIEVWPPMVLRDLDDTARAEFPDRGSSVAAAWNHPLLAEPDAFQSLGGGDVVLDPESPSGVHVRGGGSDQVAYLLDGVPILSPYHAAGVFSAWNPDALSRLDLSSSAPPPGYPDALSGVVAGVTRAPGERLRVQGSVSTTQTRLTMDGPVGVGRAGYLVSVRAGFPGVIVPRKEATYLRSETSDWLATVQAPALGGTVRLLGYDSGNEISATAVVGPAGGSGRDSRRNTFGWHSRSFGAAWRRTFSTRTITVRGWRSAGTAASTWGVPTAGVDLAAERHDVGMLAALEQGSARASTVVGIRVERSRTSYRVQPDSSTGAAFRLGASVPAVTGFAQHTRRIARPVELTLAASATATSGGLYFGPRTQLRWKPSEQLTFSGGYTRLHQFAQSLRNPESIVGSVFPVDLFLGAGAGGVPVATSDQGVIGADYRPGAGIRLGLQAYARRFEGLVLVAPREGGPFATSGFATGAGTARGVSLKAALTNTHFGILADYGFQRLRLADGPSTYVPGPGAQHVFQGGIIVFPAAGSSIRLGAVAQLGRRATLVSGEFEWEACNLSDRGCEFAGSPRQGGGPLGTASLPPYLRVDLGVRKQWHVAVGGRDGVIALFGSVANLLGRKNVLTYVQDPSTGRLTGIEMRPRAPLVVGLDWQF